MKKAKHEIKSNKPSTFREAAKIAVKAAKGVVKTFGKMTKKHVITGLPRVIPVPKLGGALPLIPIFAGLSALGALMGGTAGVANVVVNANDAKKRLAEAQRHNDTMEAIALGRTSKKGDGLYLEPYKRGYGLFLKPYNQDSKN